jgi:hypothetical protein
VISGDHNYGHALKEIEMNSQKIDEINQLLMAARSSKR